LEVRLEFDARRKEAGVGAQRANENDLTDAETARALAARRGLDLQRIGNEDLESIHAEAVRAQDGAEDARAANAAFVASVRAGRATGAANATLIVAACREGHARWS
jgi:hypothetical protein